MEKQKPAKPGLALSACLLGQRVRHDGARKFDHLLCATSGRFVERVPICPQNDIGMGVPSEAKDL